MIRCVTALFALCVPTVGLWAQNSPPYGVIPPGQNHNETVIDGGKNPELIPDSTAYRLWLITVSELPNATAADRHRQSAHLAALGLPSLEQLELVTILGDFKLRYNNLIEIYNASVKGALARGSAPDLKGFLQERDDLVGTTRATIALRLSTEGASRIDQRVQEHKKHIQLHT